MINNNLPLIQFLYIFVFSLNYLTDEYNDLFLPIYILGYLGRCTNNIENVVTVNVDILSVKNIIRFIDSHVEGNNTARFPTLTGVYSRVSSLRNHVIAELIST